VEPSRRHDNRVQEITEVTKGLKTLAKELNSPGPGPCRQLSRGVDARRRQAPGSVGPARIRLHRAGRRRGDVRLSRGILPEVARARTRQRPNMPNGWTSWNAPPTAPKCW
jgi:replicative DNA helicase